jgi:hypothetical protein
MTDFSRRVISAALMGNKTTREIADSMGIEIDARSNPASHEIGRVLRNAGFIYKRSRRSDGVKWVWYRSPHAPGM